MWHSLRRFSQFAAALMLLAPLSGATFFLGTYTASLLFSRIQLADPFAALQTGVLPLGLAALPVVLLNLLLGRLFCGWICPLGLLLEGVDWLRRRLRLKERTVPQWLRYAMAGGLLTGSLLAGQPLFERFGPQASLGRTLALERWMAFGLVYNVLVLAAVALSDLLIAKRFWCRTLCPAGVTYGLLAHLGALRVRLEPERCTRCGRCLNRCPQGRLVLQEAVAGRGGPAEGRVLVADPAACIACGECIEVCGEKALSFRFDPAPDAGRRKALVTLGVAGLVMALGKPVRAALAHKRRPVLRPPGAQPEALFAMLCVRCGKCAQVCPLNAIRLDEGSPYIEPRRAGCNLCNQCVEVCPSGALALQPGEKVLMGTAEVDRSQCLAWNGVLCRSCFVACPLQGKALRLNEESSIWRPEVDPGECAGCGLCEHVCPREQAAITVRFDI